MSSRRARRAAAPPPTAIAALPWRRRWRPKAGAPGCRSRVPEHLRQLADVECILRFGAERVLERCIGGRGRRRHVLREQDPVAEAVGGARNFFHVEVADEHLLDLGCGRDVGNEVDRLACSELLLTDSRKASRASSPARVPSITTPSGDPAEILVKASGEPGTSKVASWRRSSAPMRWIPGTSYSPSMGRIFMKDRSRAASTCRRSMSWMRPARPSSSSYHCVIGLGARARAATCCSIRASESKTRPSDPRSAAPPPNKSSAEPVPDIAARWVAGSRRCEGFGSSRCDTGGSVRSLSRNITSGRDASASASACEASDAASNAASARYDASGDSRGCRDQGVRSATASTRGQSRPVRGCRPPSARSNGRSRLPSRATIAPFRHAQPLRPPGASGTMARRCAPTTDSGFPMDPHGPGLS